MTTPFDSLFLEFQQAVAGRYSIDRELGRGGMGIVYLAREVRLDRLVAIKLLPPERAADGAIRERFMREARMAAQLSHPNIIPIHTVEEASDFVYFVMAYIDGETLTQRVQKRGPLPPSEGARVLREVAWALAFAHEQGVIHRDIKPDNVLIESGSGRALVADFGIAAMQQDASPEGAVTGTPEFMSPEQALGEAIDARSDLYSVGATAFYMFSGRFPFEGRTPTEVIAQHIAQAPPPVASLGRPVPRKLAAIIDRCLSKAPSDRPANGQVLAEQLSVALEERRELPAALRSFLKVARLDSRGTLAGAVAALAVSAIGASLFGSVAGWATLIASATVLPVASWIAAARTLLLNGFDHADVQPALNAVALQAREQRADMTPRASSTERALRWYAIVAVPGAAALNWALTWGPSIEAYKDFANRPFSRFALHFLQRLWQTYDLWTITQVYLPTILGSGILAGAAAVALAMGRREVDSVFWSKLWSGRFGRLVFGVARKLVGKSVRRVAVTHRATELSLAVAAEQLYAHLPKATRGALSDLPVALQRLRDAAQVLRKEIDRLQDALNDAGGAAMSEDFASIRETRDELLGRHREAVAELETIRLGLLRLHAGSASLESITTHLKLADEVSEHVERLIVARGDVEQSLRFPRAEVPSPA
jgi:serine/threonine-protein kinase